MRGRNPELVGYPLAKVTASAAGWLAAILLFIISATSYAETNSMAIGTPPLNPAGFPPAAVPDDRHSVLFKLLRIFSSKLREMDRTVATLNQECENLPVPPAVRQPASRGYLLNINDPEVTKSWVQVDLGSPQPINGVGIVPAKALVGNRIITDYGFPLRFRVEISDKADFSQSKIIGDFSNEDQPKPNNYPIYIPIFGATTRYVRITVTKFRTEDNHYVFALGELLVFSHGLNVAAGRPVSSPHSVEKSGVWGRQLLVDGRSYLGPPVDEKRPSPTRGFLSEAVTNLDGNHWIQIDLGREQPIEQVLLFPAHLSGVSDEPDYGLPVRFTIKAGNDPQLIVSHMLYSDLPTDEGAQMLNPIFVRGDGQPARYLRINGTQFREWDSKKLMAFAEIQVYFGGQNVALGKPVTASDAVTSPDWSPNYLTDGYNSDYAIVDLTSWYIGLARRGELLRQLNDSAVERKSVEEATATWLIGITGGIFLTTGVVWVGWAWKIRKQRRYELRRLRQQIASDLHDAIGSNLGSIALISGLATNRTGCSGELLQDFTDIQQVAEQTSEALREVVWLTDPRGATMVELITRMRELVPQILRGLEYQINIPDNIASQSASPALIHHIFLCFKETLHNVIKHSHATKVNIEVWSERQKLYVRVQDNGVGFDATIPAVGRGLRNARERATQLRGDFQIESSPGKGSTITFVATL